MAQVTGIGESVTLADLDRDPYPIYARLRAEEPVSWVPTVNLWLVTRWDDVQTIGLDHTRFSTNLADSTLTRTLGRHMMHADEPYHQRVRAIVEPALQPGGVRARAEAVIPQLVDELIEGFRERGAVDLVEEFSEPLSVRALQHIIGIQDVPEELPRRWFVGLATGASNFERDPAKQALGDAASRAVDETLAPLLDRLEPEPDDSLLAALLHTTVDGQRLTRPEIGANVKLTIIGGMQEPRDVIGTTLWGLLSNPAQAVALRSNPALARKAIEEAMRWISPVGTLTRETTEELTVAGVTLPAGTRVGAVLASANRDERHWKHPERFDIQRREGPHLAFGISSHFCVGAWLARYEARLAIAALFEQLPNLRLDPERPPEFRGWEFRGPTHLQLRWDA
jgi:cytochrome P450